MMRGTGSSPRTSGRSAVPAGFTIPAYDESGLEPLWSPGEVNQSANRRINQLVTGANDAIRDLEQRLAGTGAAGAVAERARDIWGQTAAAGAEARADTELAARQQNAEHRLAQIANLLTRRGQDIGLVTEQGRQGLQRYLGDLSAAVGSRGQDVDWLQAQLSALVTGRAQDVAQRGQDLDYLLGRYGLDINQRGQDIQSGVAQRGQDIDLRRAVLASLAQALGIEAGQRGDELRYLSTINNSAQDNFYRMLQLAMSLPSFAAGPAGQQIF